MNAVAVTEMNNVMGRLTQLESLGRLGAEGAPLFCEDAEVSVTVPELGIDAHGPEAVRVALNDVRHPRRGRGNMHLLHTAAYRAEGEDQAEGHWNTYSFCFREEDASGRFHAIRFSYLRFHVTFRKRAAHWRILRLRCDCLLSVDPWAYDPACGRAVFDWPGSEGALAVPDAFACPAPEDYIQLRNLTGRYLHNGPLKARALFGGVNPRLEVQNVLERPAEGMEAIQRALEHWEARERDNGLYLTVQMAMCPVFTSRGGERAEGSFLTLCIDSQGRAFGHTGNPYPSVMRLVQQTFDYVRVDGRWRIHGVSQTALANLNPIEQRIESGRRIVMMEQENRVLTPEESGNCVPEDAFMIESILPQWTERLKRSDLPDFVPLYMDNSGRDLAIVLSRSYFGRADVLKHTNMLINEQLHNHPSMMKFPQFHTGNTPVIEISADGRFAVAAWLDFGWGNIGAGVFYDDETVRNYYPGVGKYYHSFIKEDGRWRVYRFGWYPLMGSFAPWSYRIDNTGGWSGRDTDEAWPLPMEDFAQ